MRKVTLEGVIIVPQAELGVFQEALVLHKQQTLAEPGCITFNVIQDQTDSCRYTVYEEFVDRAAFDQHQRHVGELRLGEADRQRRAPL
ncbi:putative quinol monooxygenase [Halomonas sp. AOP43-A1-21]|uniref:putative quinol monooxygenase n=1 Tax=Halomonas sp. TaxID=1486246 RepID=UPI003F8E6F22